MKHGDEARPGCGLQESANRSPGRDASDLPSPESMVPVLRRILDNGVRDVPGADGAGVSVLTGDPSAGASRVERLLGGWSGCSEGPCVDAMRARRTRTIVLDDVPSEAAARWPLYAETAGRAGVRSVLTFVLAPPGAMPAAVTFHAGRPGALTVLSRVVGSVVAMRAAVALFGGQQVEGLLAALEAREVVGQATGILMERFGLDDNQAHAMLVSSSQDAGTPLVEIATWLVGQGKPRAS